MYSSKFRVVGCTVLDIVILQAKFQVSSIFLSRDFSFSIKLVLNHLEMGVVSILGVVPQEFKIFNFIIHQIFSLARDWSKRVTWANIPQLKLGNIRGHSPIFKTAHVA